MYAPFSSDSTCTARGGIHGHACGSMQAGIDGTKPVGNSTDRATGFTDLRPLHTLEVCVQTVCGRPQGASCKGGRSGVKRPFNASRPRCPNITANKQRRRY